MNPCQLNHQDSHEYAGLKCLNKEKNASTFTEITIIKEVEKQTMLYVPSEVCVHTLVQCASTAADSETI